jgi:hypothetical protein
VRRREERTPGLARRQPANPLYTKRFAFFVGRRCRHTPSKEVAEELFLDWHAVKELDKQYMREQLHRAGTPAPRVIGVDEIAIAKGHKYRIVVSDLERGRPLWFGGKDRSEASLDEFFAWLGPQKCGRIRLVVMDMWKAFRNSTLKEGNAPQATIVYDKFHILKHLGEAMDKVRKQEYTRLSGQDRRFVKGQRYTLLAHWENLDAKGRESLKLLFQANRRLNKAYLLKGVVRSALGLLEPRVGTAFLRAVAGRPALATAGALPTLRPHGRRPLGWDRGLLPPGKQGAAGFRGRHQQQDPGHSEAGLRLTR